MQRIRQIEEAWKSRPTIEGAGVHLNRAFGHGEAPRLDPFLLLDDFRSRRPAEYRAGFPWHPHRGIETITYMLRGRVEHGDSMGNRGTISAGDIQWMTAGSGIIHQEMPEGDDEGAMEGFQLWANLPARHKMMDPRYRGIGSASVPVVQKEAGVSVKVVCGTVEGIAGPVRDVVIDPGYIDVTVNAGAIFRHNDIPAGYTAFAYLLEGNAVFCGQGGHVDANTLVLFGRGGGGITAEAADTGVRFLLIWGRPIYEPVAWYGPIVMNTEEELRQAFEEYQNGTFIRHRSPG